MLGQEIEQMDDMAISAIGEPGNMIIGNACTLYYQKGLHTNISTPEVVVGETEDFKNLLSFVSLFNQIMNWEI